MRIDGSTRLVGVMGEPIEHTLSPAMHNAAFQALNMNNCYVPLRVHPNQLEAAVKGCQSLNFLGFNVTIPHKEAVMRFLDVISEEANLIGAVNTVVCKEGKLYGYNTDGIGFIQSLQHQWNELKWEQQNMVILGSGGAARAVAVQSALTGVKDMTLITREMDKAKDIARSIEGTIPSVNINIFAWEKAAFKTALRKSTLLVNATPLGMAPYIHQSPLENYDWLYPELIVYDLIYNPIQTRFLQEAENRGAKTQNGLDMLIFQGAAAFEKWHGIFPPVDVMRKAVQVL